MNAQSVKYAIAAAVLFGAQHVLVKDAVARMANPWLSAPWAIALGLLASLPFLAAGSTFKNVVRILMEKRSVVAVSVACGILSAIFYYMGIEKTHPAVASVILNTSFVWAAIFAWFFHRKKTSLLLAPTILLIGAGLVVQLSVNFEFGSMVSTRTPALSLLFLAAVPALYVLRPYLKDKKIEGHDATAIALSSALPSGLIGWLALACIFLSHPEMAMESFSRVPLASHCSFALGVFCVTAASLCLQKAISVATDKAIPGMFLALVPTCTISVGVLTSVLAGVLGLDLGQDLIPARNQILGGLLVTLALSAFYIFKERRSGSRC